MTDTRDQNERSVHKAEECGVRGVLNVCSVELRPLQAGARLAVAATRRVARFLWSFRVHKEGYVGTGGG